MKVWIVTEGRYSSYHVVGVFSTQESAQLFLDTQPKEPYDRYEIEEYPLDPGIDQINQGLTFWRCCQNRDGDVEDVEPATYWDTSVPIQHYIAGDRETFVCYCWARDRYGAIKITNERRVQWIAEHPGVNQ